MSKLSEFYMKQLDDEFAFELAYQEWLRDNCKEPREFEIQQMEQDFKKSSLMFESSSISNDLYYNNPKGA